MALLLAPPPSCCCRAPRFTTAAASPRTRRSPRVAPAGPSAALRDDASAPPRPAAAAIDKRRCDFFDLHKQVVPYADSLAWQESIFARKKRLDDADEDHVDTLIALQHAPAYTLGRATNVKKDVLFDLDDPPCEVHRVKRAGKATYHGPGQLVMYPILNLHRQNMDVHMYLRSLEEVIIRALKSAFSIKAYRIQKHTGVWVGDKKVAAIGIHGCFNRFLVYHGLALNVTTDLAPFKLIVPCGIKDRGVGSVKEILGKASDGSKVEDTLLMDVAYNSLMREFVELFNLSLEVQA